MSTNLTQQESVALSSLYKACDLLTSYDPEINIRRLQVMLYLSSHPGAVVRDLMKVLGMSQSAVSRTIHAVGDKKVRGQSAPLKLVRTEPDPDDPRRVLCYLTPKGETLMAKLASQLN